MHCLYLTNISRRESPAEKSYFKKYLVNKKDIYDSCKTFLQLPWDKISRNTHFDRTILHLVLVDITH